MNKLEKQTLTREREVELAKARWRRRFSQLPEGERDALIGRYAEEALRET